MESNVNAGSVPTDWSSAGGRTRWLLEKLWDGNRSAMAKSIGLSHTVINKVALGDREPGKAFLTALSKDGGSIQRGC